MLRNQKPLIRLRQARRHGAVGGLLLGLGLPPLVLIEVKLFLLGDDRRPCQILAQRLVEVLQTHLVGSEKDERVPIEAWRVPARFEDRFRRRLGGVAALLAVGVLSRENDKPRVVVVGHVGARAWHGVNAREIAVALEVGAQTRLQLRSHLVGIALELLGAVLG